jgi:hypothetical protein
LLETAHLTSAERKVRPARTEFVQGIDELDFVESQVIDRHVELVMSSSIPREFAGRSKWCLLSTT